MTTIWVMVLLSAVGAGPVSLPELVRPVPKGTLIIDGGGQPSPLVKQRALMLAGGLKAIVVILPQASNLPTSGPKAEKRWRDAGAENVSILALTDPKLAVAAILHADLIWISGGDQDRLMQRLEGTGVADAIRLRYQEGGIIGGSSAGAAVMSDIMISRSVDEYPKPLCDYPLMGRGLGLLPGVIVDQHFLKLHRADRLKRAMSEFPGLIGIGIDESTAAFVSEGQKIEVVGNSLITIFDPRLKPRPKMSVLKVSNSTKPKAVDLEIAHEPGPITISTLNPGVTFHLERGIISDPIAETR